MYRDAEKQLKSALRDQDMVDIYLYLCKVYRRLDQPLTAIDIYKKVSFLLIYWDILKSRKQYCASTEKHNEPVFECVWSLSLRRRNT